MKTPRVIFFDATGTLIHLPRGVGFHYAAIAARHGWTVDATRLGDVFRTAWKESAPPGPARQPRADDDRSWWRELVWDVLQRMAAPADFDRAAYFDEVYSEFARPGVWALYAETLPVLDALAPHFRLAVLSNFDRRLLAVLDHLGIRDRFEQIVISSEVGADKPDRWIFEHAQERCGIAPGEALLVGDDPECDIEGARLAGWQSIHIERPGTTLREVLARLSADPSAF